jgi:hypothetical protein
MTEWEYSKKQNKEKKTVWATEQEGLKSFGKVKLAVGNT